MTQKFISEWVGLFVSPTSRDEKVFVVQLGQGGHWMGLLGKVVAVKAVKGRKAGKEEAKKEEEAKKAEEKK